MNVLDRLCPYCSDEMETSSQETQWYGTLIYGFCDNCRLTFVKDETSDEWEEAAENWYDGDV